MSRFRISPRQLDFSLIRSANRQLERFEFIWHAVGNFFFEDFFLSKLSLKILAYWRACKKLYEQKCCFLEGNCTRFLYNFPSNSQLWGKYCLSDGFICNTPMTP